ncbi:homoserine kinase [Nocardiopsis trehalosi]|uniref:homoserine kinase n=1 Tax=Nocardiopsis trehalosi TaxID=109329 RepID=UPI000B2739A3|nr:homoserine kinase [Nocardiopsis trehalosi]
MSQTRPTGVRVRTPATSANLGPGFDALGLALGLYDEIEAVARDDGRVRVTVDGEGAGEVPLDGTHLVVRALRRAFDAAGVPFTGVDLRCRNAVPHGRGLGSSASAIVGGAAAGLALAAGGAEHVDRDRLFALAADIEGHPDNVAPCVYGGLTVAWRGAAGWAARRVPVSSRLRPVVCVPEERLSTEAARGLLPEVVPHGDAAFTAGRAALLVAAVSGQPELLLEATEDRLHERYRAPAMPASARLIRDLRELDGLPAVVSGAGPTVLVLCHTPEIPAAGDAARADGDTQNIGERVDSIRERTGTGWHIHPLRIDAAGVWISSPRS